MERDERRKREGEAEGKGVDFIKRRVARVCEFPRRIMFICIVDLTAH